MNMRHALCVSLCIVFTASLFCMEQQFFTHLYIQEDGSQKEDEEAKYWVSLKALTSIFGYQKWLKELESDNVSVLFNKKTVEETCCWDQRLLLFPSDITRDIISEFRESLIWTHAQSYRCIETFLMDQQALLFTHYNLYYLDKNRLYVEGSDNSTYYGELWDIEKRKRLKVLNRGFKESYKISDNFDLAVKEKGGKTLRDSRIEPLEFTLMDLKGLNNLNMGNVLNDTVLALGFQYGVIKLYSFKMLEALSEERENAKDIHTKRAIEWLNGDACDYENIKDEEKKRLEREMFYDSKTIEKLKKWSDPCKEKLEKTRKKIQELVPYNTIFTGSTIHDVTDIVQLSNDTCASVLSNEIKTFEGFSPNRLKRMFGVEVTKEVKSTPNSIKIWSFTPTDVLQEYINFTDLAIITALKDHLETKKVE